MRPSLSAEQTDTQDNHQHAICTLFYPQKMAKVKVKPPSENRPSESSFFLWDGDTLVLNILGKPSAGKDAIGKVKGCQLKISVTAAPVAGKATDHMVRFLAKEFDVACSDIEVVFGRMNVNKKLRIRSPKKLPDVIAKNQ